MKKIINSYKEKRKEKEEQAQKEYAAKKERIKQLDSAKGTYGMNILNAAKDKSELLKLKKEVRQYEEKKRNRKILIVVLVLFLCAIIFVSIMVSTESGSSDNYNSLNDPPESSASDESADEELDNDDNSTGDEPEDSDATADSDTDSDSSKGETSDSDQESSDEDEILTVSSCSDLKKILSLSNPEDKSVSEFAEKYSGYTISFDGNIAHFANHGNYKTRYDLLLTAGDYSETSMRGPYFKFEDVGASNFKSLGIDGFDKALTIGRSVVIIAKINEYNSNQGILYLYPVDMKLR